MQYRGSYLSYLLMYLFYFLSLALLSGLISVYLLDRGYSASQVSLVVASSYIVSVILQPLVGYLNDHFNLKWVNSVVLIIAAILGIALIFAKHLFSITLLYSLTLGLFNSTKPVIERMATLSKYQYGKIRIWGTIGYAIGSQIGGLIYQYISPESMYFFFSISLGICLLGIIGTRNEHKNSDIHGETTTQHLGLWNKNFIVYLIIVCLFYAITNLNTTYLPAMFQHQGISVDKVSTIILLITISELPIIYYSHRFMNNISNRHMLIIVFILLIIQFGTYCFIPYNIIHVIISIGTKAVSTVIFIMLNMKIVVSIVDSDLQMSALAWVSTFNSFSSIVGQGLGGKILDTYSYTDFYLILFLIAVIGLGISYFYHIPSVSKYHLF